MAKFRVLHIITHFRQAHGAEENTLLTVNGLRRDRFEVSLAAAPGGELWDQLHDDVICEPIVSLTREIRPWLDCDAFGKIFALIKREKYDIVHTHLAKAGFLGRLAARLAGVPEVVHTIHSFPFHDFQPWWKRRLFVGCERLASRCTDTFLAVSAENVDKARFYGIGRGARFEVVYSGIDLERFDVGDMSRGDKRTELGLEPDAPTVGWVGRLTFQKDPITFVEAAARVAQHIPNTQFLIVGDGELRYDVQSAITRLGLDDRCMLTGVRDDVPGVLAAADVLAHSSLYEGMGRVICEAMIVGTPIVATRVDGVVEAVGQDERGTLVPPQDSHALAQAIINVLENRTPALAKAREAKKWALEKLSVEQMINRIEQVYEERIDGRKHQR